MNWNKFFSTAFLVLASALASAIIYNEMFLKPLVKKLAEGEKASFVYYPSMTAYIVVILIFISLAIFFEKNR